MANLYVADGYFNNGYIQTGISINWGTGVIFVPKSELTLVQTTPTEIYELNLNFFRLSLKSLEDDAEGMPYTITHIHNTEVSLGGLTYARVIEIIEPYTVTFEDGKYAVNLVGANSNVGDRVNVNNVSVRSANSAGMTSSPDIEYSSFNGMVTVDVTSNYSGTVFPVGTPRQPVNNIADARLIREYRGLPPKLYIIGNITIGVDANIDNYEIQGQEPTKSTITVLTEAEAYGCIFVDCMLTGVLDGNSTVKDSVVYDLTYVFGFVYNCLISEVGELTLGGGVKAYFLNCYSGKGTVHGSGFPTINCGGASNVLVMHNYNGDISIKNKTGVESATINLNAGAIELQASCTNGTIECQGTGSLEDYTTDGCVVYADDLMNSTNIASATLDAELINHTLPDTVGLAFVKSTYGRHMYVDAVNGFAGQAFPIGIIDNPSNNTTDSLVMAIKYDCNVIHFHSDYVMDSSEDLEYLTIKAHNHIITVDATVNTKDTTFEHVNITGVVIGPVEIYHSTLYDILLSGEVYDCVINGTITPTSNVTFHRCNSPTGTPITIDMSDNGHNAKFPNWKGNMKIVNLASGTVGVNADTGTVTIDASCTGGTISVSGLGDIIDNSNGTVVISRVMNASVVSSAVWDEAIADHLIAGSTGLSVGIAQFGNVITVDSINGASGTEFPIGTESYPVDNIPDAVIIGSNNGINDFSIKGNITINDTEDVSRHTIRGESVDSTTVTVISGSILTNTVFIGCTLFGAIDANVTLFNCRLNDVTGFRGAIYDTLIEGDIHLAGGESTTLLNCWRGEKIPIGIPPIIDMGGSGQQLALRSYTGGIEIRNFDEDTGRLSIDLLSGKVLLHETITGIGEVVVRGVGQLFDNSSNTNIDITGLVNKDTVSVAVWSIPLGDFSTYGTMGSGMNDISYTEKRIYINTDASTNGNGKMSEPFNNVADAVDFAESVGWSVLVFLADAELERNLKNFTIEGIGLPKIDLNGQNVDKTEFRNIQLTGTQVGSIVATDCILLDGITGINGSYKSVGIIGNISLAEDSYVNMLSTCVLFQPNTTVPTTIDMGVSNTNVTLNMRKTSGAITIKNVNTTTKLATIEFSGGRLYMDDTNTAGTIAVTGLVDSSVFDSSAGSVVRDFGLMPSANTITDEVWNEQLSTHVLAGSTGEALADIPDTADISDAVWTSTSATQLLANVELIKQIETGKWQIINNQMIFYKDDNTTEVVRFNLFGKTGLPAEENVYQRVKV